jgi:phosphoenolpyruvate-protein kinase (PTS system EI component)
MARAVRALASDQTVVLLDYTTNGDVTDLSTPLSHAALIAQHIEVPA